MKKDIPKSKATYHDMNSGQNSIFEIVFLKSLPATANTQLYRPSVVGFTNVINGSGGHRSGLAIFSFLGAAPMLVGFCQLIKNGHLITLSL